MLDIRQHDDNFIKEENARHLWHPMAHPADSQSNPPTIVTKGEGVYITDLDGHRVIDAVGGLWNVNLGFSCDPIKQAITEQLDRLPYYSIFRGTTNDVAVELSHELAQFSSLTACSVPSIHPAAATVSRPRFAWHGNTTRFAVRRDGSSSSA